MERLLNVKEVALTLNISKKYVYSLVSEGKLPCLKLANKYLFSTKEVENFVKSNISTNFAKQPEEKAITNTKYTVKDYDVLHNFLTLCPN